MDKFLCFRFDVDTHVCIKDGVPNLIELFKKYDARCTVFVNMGRAFNWKFFLEKKIKSLFSKTINVGFYSVSKKLGFINTLQAIFINPKVGAANGKILNQILKNGHEIGLHGGKNHATWEKNAKNWNYNHLEKEIEYGLSLFNKLNLPSPISFASPCWNSPDSLNEILKSKNISILADNYDLNNVPKKDYLEIIHYPTNILGSQGNIGFIENLRALGYSTAEIITEFENQLDKEGNFKMVFDHPYYIGVYEIELLTQMIELSIKKGYKIESLKNISKAF